MKKLKMILKKLKNWKKGRQRKFSLQNTLGRDIYKGKKTLKEANEDQSDLLLEILNFRK